MKRIAAVLVLLTLAAAPMRADFDGIVRAVSRTRGLHRVDIPMLGLARFAVWIVHPKGVHDFQLATFEGSGTIDGETARAILNAEGSGFTPIVHARSNRTGEWSLIYAKPGGRTVEMIVVSHDKSETVVVRAVVDVDTFTKEINGERRVATIARAH